MMPYITNINKSNIADQLPLIMTNSKTCKETMLGPGYFELAYFDFSPILKKSFVFKYP